MKLWSSKFTKGLSIALAAALMTGTVGIVSYADVMQGDGSKEIQTEGVVSQQAQEKAAGDTDILNLGMESPVDKEETVYVLAGADGDPNQVIVSDWLKNPDSSDTIEDYTELTDVKNVKGDQDYTADGNGQYVWNADGSDIYYQGTTEKELPIGVHISYLLDGKEISGEELAGKSGKVTIRFDYENREKQNVLVDGKHETMYVPFLVVTGAILDNSVFTNIEVSNGKLVNDGDRSIVMGFALPGMQENLEIEKDVLEIPDYVEIRADVENFALTDTITIAANEVFQNLEINDTGDLEELSDALKELNDASKQLVDGSAKLYDGLSELLAKSGDLISGIDQLYDGAVKLQDGTGTLQSGVGTLKEGAGTLKSGTSALKEGAAALKDGTGSLQTGAAALHTGLAQLNDGFPAFNAGLSELNGGLNTLAANNGTLNDGARQVFESLLSMADSQLAAAGLSVPKLTIENYRETLIQAAGSLDAGTIENMAYQTALQQVTEAVNAQRSVINAQVEAAVRNQVLEGVLAAAGQPMSAQDYENAAAAGMISAEQQAQITAAVDAQMATEEIKNTVNAATESKVQELIQSNMASEEVQSQIRAAVSQAQAGAGSINSLLSQLDSYNTFYQGLLTYTAGVSSACEGSNQLVAGAAQLSDGAAALLAGSEELEGGTASLTEGAAKLYDGISSADDGTGQLYTGISTLSDGAGSLAEGVGQLKDGIGTLKTGSDALTDGVTQLKDGAMQLSEGMKEFDEEGIQKLADAFDGDLNGLISRCRAMSDAAKTYQSFAGISKDMTGTVKFIYRTDAIE